MTEIEQGSLGKLVISRLARSAELTFQVPRNPAHSLRGFSKKFELEKEDNVAQYMVFPL